MADWYLLGGQSRCIHTVGFHCPCMARKPSISMSTTTSMIVLCVKGVNVAVGHMYYILRLANWAWRRNNLEKGLKAVYSQVPQPKLLGHMWMIRVVVGYMWHIEAYWVPFIQRGRTTRHNSAISTTQFVTTIICAWSLSLFWSRSFELSQTPLKTSPTILHIATCDYLISRLCL